MATKLNALQMAIRVERENLDRAIRDNEQRIQSLTETSALYAFVYGELTAQKGFRETLKRWEA